MKKLVIRYFYILVLLAGFLTYITQPIAAKIVEPTLPDGMTLVSDQSSTPVPGITLHEMIAYSGDGQRVELYVTETDLSSGHIQIYASYYNNQQEVWGMQKLTEQAAVFEENHPDMQVVAAFNGSYYDMSSGEPLGAMAMEGVEAPNRTNDPNARPFFAILKNGTPYIGTAGEYNGIKDQIAEAIGGEITLIDNGTIVVDWGSDWKYPRQTIGITADGKVITMAADGYRKPVSDGVSLMEQAEIMLELGCVEAIHLDGGGSATTCIKPEGENELQIINVPADGFERPVSSALLFAYSGTVSSEFDHAVLETDSNRIVSGSNIDITVVGVSNTGHNASIPEGATLQVLDDTMGRIEDNIFIANTEYIGDAVVQLTLGNDTLGETTIHVFDYSQLNVSCIDGIYYEVDDAGQLISKYTGLFLDSDGSFCYALNGEIKTGWVLVGGNWHYFNWDGKAVSGKLVLTDGVEFEFEENGKLVDGVWVKLEGGTRYYYGPGYYRATGANSYSKWVFYTIHGNDYCFDTNGYRLEGIQWITASSDRDHYWYDFGTDGIAKKFDYTGPYTYNGELTFIFEGVTPYNKGLFMYEGNYYNLTSTYILSTGLYNVYYHNDLLQRGNYVFAEDGKMIINGVTYWASILCYLEDGVPTAAGVIYDEADNCFYYARTGGKISFGEVKVPANRTNGLIPAGTYNFGEDGKLPNNCESLGHNWHEATCTTEKICTRCNITEDEPLGHSWTDATCIDPITCLACGMTQGEPLGHKWTDATCTAAKICSTCKITDGDPSNHSWTEATCTNPKTCSACGAIDGVPLGHEKGDWTVTKEPSTETEGEKISICQRIDCSHTEVETIPVIEHPDGWIKVGNNWYYSVNGEALTNEWVLTNNKWYYLDADGIMATGWINSNGNWYLLGTSGYMKTGWIQSNNNWYYLGTDGAMRTDWQYIDSKWYYLGTDGIMRTDWIYSGGEWYYLGADGSMRTGWKYINGEWYYLGTDGAMRTGWKYINDEWYYLGTDGAMRTGWKYINDEWYYLGTDGAMRTDWKYINDEWYYLGTDGAMRTDWIYSGGKWYYLGADGTMKTGWLKIDSEWYYLSATGEMVTGTQSIDGKTYKFDSSGAWIGQ